MAVEDDRDIKEINAQLIFLEMYYVFKCLKPDGNITEELYKVALSNMAGANNKFRRIMYGEKVNNSARRSFNDEFNFSSDLCNFKRHLLDYDTGDNDIDIDKLKEFAYYEHNSEAINHSSKRKYKEEKVNKTKAERIKKECESKICDYAMAVRNILEKGSSSDKAKIAKTDIGKFIIRIGAATGIEQSIAEKFIDNAKVLIKEYESRKKEIITATADSPGIYAAIKAITPRIGEMYEDLEALERIESIKRK